LIEAAVAYYNATGKRKLLDVAIKFADHFDSQFGPDKKHWGNRSSGAGNLPCKTL